MAALKNIGPKPRNPKSKPYFPSGGYWRVRIGKRTVTLARWTITDLDELDRLYEQKKAALAAESAKNPTIKMVASGDYAGLTFRDGVNLYMDERARQVGAQSGTRISPLTYAGYDRCLRWTCARIGDVRLVDFSPQVFTAFNGELASNYGPRQHDHIVLIVRMVFKWLFENGFIGRPPLYGTAFRTMGVRAAREARAAKAPKMFSAQDIAALLRHADDQMRAMIYLGINCAYLVADLAELPIAAPDMRTFSMALDAKIPYIRFDRVKTGERRKAVLWPETVTALQAVIGGRKEGLVFQTRRGFPLAHEKMHYDDRGNLLKVIRCNSVIKPFRELCVKAGLRKSTVGEHGMPAFSALRTTFNTVAYSNPDLSVANVSAIAWVMGHSLAGQSSSVAKMADTYIADIPLPVLKLVSDHVRSWLLEGKRADGVRVTQEPQKRVGTPNRTGEVAVVSRF